MSSLPKIRRMGALNCAGQGVVVEGPVPPIQRGEVMVRVRASLVSPGTEFSGVRGVREALAAGQPKSFEPRPFGYQNAGDVIAVGKGVKRWKEGDRVACMGKGAGHTDIAVVPQNLCFRLPEAVSYEQGAFNHLAATALHAVRRVDGRLGEYLLIAGMGMVGQLSAQVARLAGHAVMGWDREAWRLKLAARCGLDAGVRVGEEDVQAAAVTFTQGHGFDAAILAFGGQADEALNQIISVMRQTRDGHRWGRVVFVGGATATVRGGAGLGNLDICGSARTGAGYHDHPWELGEVEYPPVFMRWTTQTNQELVMRLIASGRLKVKPLISHRIPLAEIHRAVDLHLNRPGTTMGTVLLMD